MKSEGEVQNECRLLAPYLGLHLFRNNVGQLPDENGRPVRYGLANDSKALNREVKSGDLIGWELVTITPGMVGKTLPVFASVETKPEGWTPPRPTNKKEYARYEAQLVWLNLVLAAGGRAQFVTDASQLIR